MYLPPAAAATHRSTNATRIDACFDPLLTSDAGARLGRRAQNSVREEAVERTGRPQLEQRARGKEQGAGAWGVAWGEDR